MQDQPWTGSIAEWIASLSASQREAELSRLAPTEQDRKALEYAWRFWARPKQLPPPGEWFCWLLRSGRGFGKTRTGAQWVTERALNGPYEPIALVGQTKADVRDTMIELGESSILKISPPWFTPRYEVTKRRLVWPNGMVAVAYSGDEPDQLRGPQHGSAWVDELAKFKYPKETWDNLELGLRLGPAPQVVVTTTPRPIPIIKQLIADPMTVDVAGSSYENMANLAPQFIKRVISRYEGTRLGQQEVHGDILDDVPGALWNREILEETRVRKHPDLVRVVVGVDPQASTTEGTSETGIVAAGLGADGHGYVLDDASISASPHGWASQSVSAYHKHRADRLAAEVNNGGDMVASTISTIDPTVAIKVLYASRGKYTRAEPVSTLYERKMIHHVGMFAALEDQLCSWVPGETSPDRLDALVWAITELMLGDSGPMEVVKDNPFYA